MPRSTPVSPADHPLSVDGAAGAVVAPIEADQAPLLARPFYAGGDPGPITATMAYVPELLETALPFIGGVLGASSIAFRTKEIVILRTSALLSCRYCVDSHTPVALDAGLSRAEVDALRDAPTHDAVAIAGAFADDRERALISWTDAVATGRGAVDDAVTTAFTAAHPEHEVVELTLLVATTLLLNRYASSLRLPVGEATLTRLAAAGFAAGFSRP